MRPLRVAIVDDEPLARRAIRAALERRDDVQVVLEAGTAAELAAGLDAACPELLFLDVQMPGGGGFELLDELGEAAPPVVFVTAWEEHALRAFEVAALDYLLKPFDDDRVALSLERARERLRREPPGEQRRRVAGLVASGGATRVGPTPPAERLAVRSGGRVQLVDPLEVDWIEADDYYARLHVGERQLLIRESLARLEARLPPGFARVHRSAIVRLERVVELRSGGRGEATLVLGNGARVRVSRHRRERVRQALGLDRRGSPAT